MTPIEVLPFVVFAKADAVAGAMGGLTRSLTVKDTLVRIGMSCVIGGSVAYYLSPLLTLLLIMYSKDNPKLVEYLVDNARNPIGFVVGFLSIYLTTLADRLVAAVSKRVEKQLNGGKND